ncbi:Glycosyltransferase involved in cell wall bisynthesis [Thalassobacillus cyri]|uniref:Glycosyltransferase involved in cell wall bisynthesis n=2 Tax=Thalassobacillus cyri TaxID=571932 RepID=A0A1H4DVG5_9BACI|nr:Glycosyltransferase involved in cell wall bisynthesis [Thalassobacillus cyri]
MEDSRNRILIVSNMYPGKHSETYGIFVKNQVEALRKKGHKIDVAAIDDARTGKFNNMRKYLVWLLHALYAVFRYKDNYKLVHAHYVFPSGLIGLLSKKLFGTKLVVTAHGGDINKLAKKNKFYFNQTKRILQASDVIIAVGEDLQKQIIEDFHVDSNNVRLMSMGVDRSVFAPIPKFKAKKETAFDIEGFHILFVGNHIREKGLMELLESYQQLKAQYDYLRLHLIGSQKNQEFLEELNQRIEEKRIIGVSLHGPKNQEELSKYMAAADVLVLPSYSEGFGLVALEAMSANTPVVGSDVGGLSHLLAENAGILVKPKDSAALSAGIEELIRDPEKGNLLVAQGDKKAELFSQQRIIEELSQIYQLVD